MRKDVDGDEPMPFGWWESLAIPAVAVVAVILLAGILIVLLYTGKAGT